jgi:hypothetical protein
VLTCRVDSDCSAARAIEAIVLAVSRGVHNNVADVPSDWSVALGRAIWMDSRGPKGEEKREEVGERPLKERIRASVN